jgi:hypothetical protein
MLEEARAFWSRTTTGAIGRIPSWALRRCEDETITTDSNPGSMHIPCFGADRNRAGGRGTGRHYQPRRRHELRDSAGRHEFTIDGCARHWYCRPAKYTITERNARSVDGSDAGADESVWGGHDGNIAGTHELAIDNLAGGCRPAEHGIARSDDIAKSDESARSRAGERHNESLLILREQSQAGTAYPSWWAVWVQRVRSVSSQRLVLLSNIPEALRPSLSSQCLST